MHLIRSLLLLVALLGAPAWAEGLLTFPTGAVTIETATAKVPIQIELATTDPQREQGLMYRHKLAADAGMLFLYTSPQPIAMWMKNTLIPLDILFIRADGTIVNYRERAVPESLETLPSDGAVTAALELNGGTVARLGIKPGDKVVGEGLGGGKP